MSVFDHIPEVPQDATFAILDAFKFDNDANKVNLCPGIYQDEDSQTWVLPSVKQARAILVADQNLKHDILPQTGYSDFVSLGRQLVFKDTLTDRVVTSMQTISGTGANHFIAHFLSDVLPPKTIWLPNPTWDNHGKLWTHVNPAIEQRLYPYFDYKTSTLDSEGMIATLKAEASRGDAIILHACAHNPTGLDPSRDLWEAIAQVCEEKMIFPIFDLAYQGFATGDVDNDAWAVRHFATRSDGIMEFAVAQSFSKNFGLYGERVGALHVVSRTHHGAAKVKAGLKQISRAEITSCPRFGAKIVATILKDPALRQQWQCDLDTMSGRLRNMRSRLYDELMKRNTPGDWDHLLTDIGMFSFSGLSPKKVTELKDRFNVYLLPNGRISCTGLTDSNVEYVAESIHQVVVDRWKPN